MPRDAVVLLSGGLDSATSLAVVRDWGFACHALTVDYEQRHRCELDAARAVAASQEVVVHRIVRIDLRTFGGSALTADIPVPKGRTDREIAGGIPVTYVPARNTILLSYALAFAEVLGARDIVIGVNAVDYSGYPDCRPGFIAAFERVANLATKMGIEGEIAGDPVRIHAPLINLTKAEIIRRGLELGVNYALTHSCYDPGEAGRPCGRCDSCLIRAEGFAEAGVVDPAAGEPG